METATSLIAAVCLLAQAQSETTPVSTEQAVIQHARVFLIDDVQIPAGQAGILKSLSLEDGTLVEEGVEVAIGTLLGKLDDKDAAARHEAAVLDHRVAQAEEQKSLVAITAAKKTADVARAEYDESIEVNSRIKDAIPQTQIRRQKLTEERAVAEAKVAESDSETAKLTVDLRGAQLKVANINLERHEIRSELAGEIVQVYRDVGEWVNPGDPILRVVRLDTLRVDGYLQLSQYDRARVADQPVLVQIVLQGKLTEFEGKISYVSPLVDTNGEYRVWCDIKNQRINNQWVILPGMEATMRIRLKSQQQLATLQR